MSKKFALIFIIMNIIFFSVPFYLFSQADYTADDNSYQIIPDDAIRLRILANSDMDEDQDLKHKVRDEVSDQVSEWVQHIADIDEARALIQDRLPEIETVVDNVLHEESSKQQADVSYGENVTFPVKLYGDYLYPAGEYEAILISLGEGEGSNWWCVLFPPLCFLDFDHGATVEKEDEEDEDEDVENLAQLDHQEETEEDEEVEVKFFLFEWLGWS